MGQLSAVEFGKSRRSVCRGLHSTARRVFVVTALCALGGCSVETPNTEAMEPHRPNQVLQADSGAYEDDRGRATWRSVVVAGVVREIHEQVDLHGAMTGERMFEYDTAGILRRVTERQRPPATRTTWDTTAARQPDLVSTIHFAADGPALASRHVGERPLGFRRLEMVRLQKRGYALLDSAR